MGRLSSAKHQDALYWNERLKSELPQRGSRKVTYHPVMKLPPLERTRKLREIFNQKTGDAWADYQRAEWPDERVVSFLSKPAGKRCEYL